MTDFSAKFGALEIINRHNFVIKKKYGQNFLIDDDVTRRIALAAQLTKDDFVLEIGPGLGTLTRILCGEAAAVAAVEIDKKLIPILDETLAGFENVTILNEDILKTDIEGLIKEHSGGRRVKVVANLPYYITTQTITRLLSAGSLIESITVMLQKEVAQRIAAGPGTKDYGALSLAAAYRAETSFEFSVPASCFLPRPNVDSAVIRMDIRKKPPVETDDEEFMFRVIKAVFGKRRKTIVNALAGDPGTGLLKEDVLKAADELGIAGNVRGETFSLETFAAFSDAALRAKREREKAASSRVKNESK